MLYIDTQSSRLRLPRLRADVREAVRLLRRATRAGLAFAPGGSPGRRAALEERWRAARRHVSFAPIHFVIINNNKPPTSNTHTHTAAMLYPSKTNVECCSKILYTTQGNYQPRCSSSAKISSTVVQPYVNQAALTSLATSSRSDQDIPTESTIPAQQQDTFTRRSTCLSYLLA